MAAREKPDLIVYESLAEAGAVVAGRLSIPSVLQENTLWPATDLFRAVKSSTALAGQEVPGPVLTIAVTPRSLRQVTAPDAVVMRPVPFSGRGRSPGLAGRPG